MSVVAAILIVVIVGLGWAEVRVFRENLLREIRTARAVLERIEDCISPLESHEAIEVHSEIERRYYHDVAFRVLLKWDPDKEDMKTALTRLPSDERKTAEQQIQAIANESRASSLARRCEQESLRRVVLDTRIRLRNRQRAEDIRPFTAQESMER